jgi:hypothetical protein
MAQRCKRCGRDWIEWVPRSRVAGLETDVERLRAALDYAERVCRAAAPHVPLDAVAGDLLHVVDEARDALHAGALAKAPNQ